MAQTVRLHPLVRSDLSALQLGLQADFGLAATLEVVVAALIRGTSVPQAAGMLMEFNRATARKPPQ